MITRNRFRLPFRLTIRQLTIFAFSIYILIVFYTLSFIRFNQTSATTESASIEHSLLVKRIRFLESELVLHNSNRFPLPNFDSSPGEWSRKVEFYSSELLFHLTANSDQTDLLQRALILKASIEQQRKLLYASYYAPILKNISLAIKSRINRLQFPESIARSFDCDLRKSCGFACQIHHVGHCFLISFAKGRYLHLSSIGWQYDPKGFENLFEPIGKPFPYKFRTRPFGSSLKNDHIAIPIIDFISPRPEYLPMAVPETLDYDAKTLIDLHGNPFAYLMGHFMAHVLKPRQSLKLEIDAKRKRLRNVSKGGPVVGIHVRRSDKVNTEAAFHPLDEYMKQADQFFAKHELFNRPVTAKRVIYAMSDDPDLLEKASAYSEKYEIIFDEEAARSGSSVGDRYNPQALRNLFIDITLMSESDFIVCTFSSQICRLAYELMLHHRADEDASWRFRSLDDVYYFGGQNPHELRARFAHKAKDKSKELSFEVGDVIGIAGNHWNGQSAGMNTRTKKSGVFPSYKCDEIVRSVLMFNSTD